MSVASLGSLAVATAGMQMVHDIIGAMRAADAAAAAENSHPAATVATSQPHVATVVVRHDVYEKVGNRQGQSGATCNPSPTYPVQPHRYNVQPALPRPALEPATPSDCPSSRRTSKLPIQPPWATLPWQEPAKQIVRVKVVQQHTDILSKGSLLDMFI